MKCSAWWIVLSGQITKSAPIRASLAAEASMISATPFQSSLSMQAM